MDNTIVGIFITAIIMIGIFLFRQSSNTNKILLDIHTRLGIIEGILFKELKINLSEKKEIRKK
jgi:hypothetical protein